MRKLLLKAVARYNNARWINFDTHAEISKQLDIATAQIKGSALQKQPHTEVFENAIELSDAFADTNSKIAALYDVEYSRSAPQNNYAYASPVCTVEGFRELIRDNYHALAEKRILDVGAGSNELLCFLRDVLKCPTEHLFACDISTESVARIQNDGFNAFHGTIAEIPEEEKFDIIVHSYFIDFDTDQKTTFEKTISLLKPGGICILEAKLPCFPMSKNIHNRTVTRGWFAFWDAQLLITYFSTAARNIGRAASVLTIAEGHRVIYSRYGLHRLTSTSIVYKAYA